MAGMLAGIRLKERGDTEVVCLIATEDEAFTYNRRINRLATVQEHKMMLLIIKMPMKSTNPAKSLRQERVITIPSVVFSKVMPAGRGIGGRRQNP